MLEKLEVFAVDPLSMNGEVSEELVLCVKLTDRWCKPLKEIGFGFDDIMRDQNTGIQMALWRLDLKIDKKVDLLFDPNTQLDSFQQRHLVEFLNKHTKRGE